jgi:hypothetical protein
VWDKAAEIAEMPPSGPNENLDCRHLHMRESFAKEKNDKESGISEI